MEPDVHLMAGLNGSGKTTLARQLEASLPGVRFSLDEWMLRLHGLSYDDPNYAQLAEGCRGLIWDTAAQVLNAHRAVIMDWNFWSRERRAEAVARAAALGTRCQLHYVKVPVGVAIARASDRHDAASHRLTHDDIVHLSQLFEPPESSEGFTLHVIDRDG